ncbi:sugar kinase [Phaeovulum sp. W22_SRMD_FR3]|uniref:sugar kinase n=1 Tax=Phaeovulum sp. W22_SRMD_FR3 TaxID=3240274 RepID=UPI003F9E50AD
MVKVICLGEAMGELAFAPDGTVAVGVGGDTLNTAVYLARAGVRCGFASALGRDPFGDRIRAVCMENGVDTGQLRQIDSHATGLYAITTDASGERSFQYWRDSSAARQCLQDAPADWTEALLSAAWLYLSGITLWVLQADADRLIAVLDAVKARGGRIAFDGNYRPRLWGTETATARALFAETMARADLILPTFEDEQMLWGDASPEATLARLHGLGPAQIVLKQGAEGCLIADGTQPPRRIAIPEAVTPLDTTAAGDSFNAGYLAAWLQGASPEAAALAGHRLAARVICHRGAILPPEDR